MIKKPSIFKKIKPSFSTKKVNFHFDNACGPEIKGWCSNGGEAPIAIKFTWDDQVKIVIANVYRPDVARVGLHPTGECGFVLAINKILPVKAISYEVLGEVTGHNIASPERGLCFIHIPKTAGTSFRRAAADYYGKHTLLANYGAKSSETSEYVKEHILEKKDKTLLGYPGNKFFSLYHGHFHLNSVPHIFPAKNIASFLRQPVDQVISHFNHYRRWHSYENSLEAFIKTRGFSNLQTRYLKSVPINLIGFIGVTENFDEGLSIYNHLYRSNLKAKRENINDKKDITVIDNTQRVMIEHYNKQDLALYEFCRSQFLERHKLFNENLPWVYAGFTDNHKETSLIQGVAYYEHSDEPVNINVFYEGRLVETVIANEFRGWTCVYKVPRAAYVGFSYKPTKPIDISKVKLLVELTGQQIQPFFEHEH